MVEAEDMMDLDIINKLTNMLQTSHKSERNAVIGYFASRQGFIKALSYLDGEEYAAAIKAHNDALEILLPDDKEE